VHDNCQGKTREDDFDKASSNHYDNPGKVDPSDLYDMSSTNGPDYVEGANDPGIFLGLEVIDGSHYSVEKIPVVNPVTKKGTGGFVTKLVIKEAVPDPALQPRPPKEEKEAKEKGEKGGVQRNKRKRSITKNGHKEENSELERVTQENVEAIREAWSNATGGVCLHPKLCRSLHRLGFLAPTPIQSNTLAASILGQRDIVGAAPTGSVSAQTCHFDNISTCEKNTQRGAILT
jgi:Superfamily II DNA and RNA helicases